LLRISLRTVALEIPSQDVITRDNISIKVNAVVYFRVVDPNKAVVEVENYLYATSHGPDDTAEHHRPIPLERTLSKETRLPPTPRCLGHTNRALGDQGVVVETKQWDIDTDMRGPSPVSWAERERRAKVIHAEERPRPQRSACSGKYYQCLSRTIHLRFFRP